MRGLLAGAGGRRRGGGRAEGEGGGQRGEAGEARQDVEEEGKEEGGRGGGRSLDEVRVAVAAVVMLENNFKSFLEDYRKVCFTFSGKRRVRKRGGGRR